MKATISIWSCLVSMIFVSTTSHATVEDSRCKSDFQRIDNLTIPEAAGRVAWTIKCFPAYRAMLSNKGPNGGMALQDSASGTIRDGYPVFGIEKAEGVYVTVKAPVSASADCSVGRAWALIGWCVGGCYTPDQLVLLESGIQEIGSVKGDQNIATLQPEATLDNLQFKYSPLHSVVRSDEAEQQTILVFEMESGGELKVTENHPLIDSNGNLRRADSLKVGESLVQYTMKPDAIVAIKKTDYFGKVYNVGMASQEWFDNVVVVQGYLNGTVYYQNAGAKELNRMILRVSSVIPERLVK